MYHKLKMNKVVHEQAKVALSSGHVKSMPTDSYLSVFDLQVGIVYIFAHTVNWFYLSS